ncbi:glycosyltransferase family 2 protein [Pedobacter polysacchareus]|uniref:glycosyltransferase family 2 protein n=1 Tax=Pedobacter polysacchareus TaxID=2861973 RepID=UPI001C9A174B|nr:glycosyltransferase family 2 protein [Pedobacter polysacchareus]
MNKGITVLVCTYNGATRLAKTIEHLASQKTGPALKWELIVIDNASKDDSAAVAQTEWNKYNLPSVPFIILSEQKPGKIYALELGAAKAKFEYLLICDDDNWLNPDYLERMYAVLDHHPQVGAVGGQGIAVCDLPSLPTWFRDYAEGYATGKQRPQTGDATTNGHLWGAGLGTRTSLYQQMYMGFPSLLTGRLGKQLTAGEDAEYCQRLILADYKLYYDENLIFKHYMPENRLQSEYRVNLFKGFTESNKILHKYYLANALKLKSEKNLLTKMRLLLVTPFRFLTASTIERKEKAKDTLIFLSPFEIGKNTVMLKIKKFYQAVHR